MYSFGFHGYIDNIEGFNENIRENKLSPCKFSKKHRSTIFKKSYYPSLMNHNPIKNTTTFKTNKIITGPNASGKTTVLKTSLINVIISQQMGFGFYESATIYPFKFIHCYLNIPDTSGRDSLFQAEARRCKEILDIVLQNSKDTHFCVFDELYSGTNPEEAIVSANAFMTYLVKYKKVTCMLTTHFHKLCDHLGKNELIDNYHMQTQKTDDNFKYTYLMKPGISTIRGGIKVLHDMNYPQEIIDETEKML